MSVTLRQMEAFVAVADEQHFGRAAEKLGVAQPTISKEIRTLERRLGLTLLDRSKRVTRLTSHGEALLPLARQALSTAGQFTRVARLLRRQNALSLTLSVSPSMVNRLSPLLLSRIERDHPRIEVNVIDVDTGEVEETVVSGKADLGIGHFLRPQPSCRVEQLGSSRLELLAAPQVTDLVSSPQDLSGLRDTPLLLWPRENNPEYFDTIMQVCRSRGLEPLLLMGGRRLSGSRGYLLREGRAFSIIPTDFARAHQEGHAVLRLGEDAQVSLDAIWQEPATNAVTLALQLASELVGNTPDD